MNSVVTTRNLLEAALAGGALRRFVNISSFAVYSNVRQAARRAARRIVSDRRSSPQLRGDAYCFAKVKQDEIVEEYGSGSASPYVIVRPGYVYGPGN